MTSPVSGWLVYSPVMIAGVVGMLMMVKKTN